MRRADTSPKPRLDVRAVLPDYSKLGKVRRPWHYLADRIISLRVLGSNALPKHCRCCPTVAHWSNGAMPTSGAAVATMTGRLSGGAVIDPSAETLCRENSLSGSGGPMDRSEYWRDAEMRRGIPACGLATAEEGITELQLRWREALVLWLRWNRARADDRANVQFASRPRPTAGDP
jgi:hypothetical protein